jgi:NADPH:quinone reductase-like Zn-dependent oxidoreductase
VNGVALLSRRDRLAETAWVPQPVPDPPDGAVLVEVEAVALTANTFTYGRLGDALRYWDFFPTGRPGWGCLPGWGTGVVRESRHPGLPVGSRLLGMLPLATHGLLVPARVSATAVRDGSAHRDGLPVAYQHYERLPGDPGPSPDEQLRALLHPLFVLAYLLADQLVADDPGTVLLTSASSRTAEAIAQQLADRPVRVLGLTSAGRVDAVAAGGLFDAVLDYADLGALPGGPATLVDLAGDAALRSRIRDAVREDLRTVLVGATHGGPDPLRAGPGEQVFSAVDRLRVLARGISAAGLAERQERAWQEYKATCGARTGPRFERGRGAVEAAYREVLAGRCAPGHGHLLVPG